MSQPTTSLAGATFADRRVGRALFKGVQRIRHYADKKDLKLDVAYRINDGDLQWIARPSQSPPAPVVVGLIRRWRRGARPAR